MTDSVIVLKMVRTLQPVPDPREAKLASCREFLGDKYLLSRPVERIPCHNVLRDGVKNG